MPINPILRLDGNPPKVNYCEQMPGCPGDPRWRITHLRGKVLLSCDSHSRLPSFDQSQWSVTAIRPATEEYERWLRGTEDALFRQPMDSRDAPDMQMQVSVQEVKLQVHIASGNPLAVVAGAVVAHANFLRSEAEANAYTRPVQRVRRNNVE